MPVSFSQRPGRHERHYRRRVGNPLFKDAPAAVDGDVLLEQQRLDHEELLDFLGLLRATVGRAVALKPNEGSEVILDIKEQLDRLYEASAGLADDHTDNQAAIRQLLDVIMRNVERGAAGDPQAADELQQEREARATHFALLESPLVADLLHPQSCIEAGDLAPTLLSADPDELDLALQLFDAQQLGELYADAEQCLTVCPAPPQGGAERLAQIAARLTQVSAGHALN
jgi:hypothetical protein